MKVLLSLNPKLLCIVFFLPIVSHAQSSISSEEEGAIIDIAKPFAKSILTKHSCEYIKGGIKLERRVLNSYQNAIVYKGSIRYDSPNCNMINATLEVTIVKDGSEVDIQKVCIYMPTCFLGSPLDMYNWDCEKKE